MFLMPGVRRCGHFVPGVLFCCRMDCGHSVPSMTGLRRISLLFVAGVRRRLSMPGVLFVRRLSMVMPSRFFCGMMWHRMVIFPLLRVRLVVCVFFHNTFFLSKEKTWARGS